MKFLPAITDNKNPAFEPSPGKLFAASAVAVLVLMAVLHVMLRPEPEAKPARTALPKVGQAPNITSPRVAGEPLWAPTAMAVAALKRIIGISTDCRIMRVKMGKAILLRDTEVIDTNDNCERWIVRPPLAS